MNTKRTVLLYFNQRGRDGGRILVVAGYGRRKVYGRSGLFAAAQTFAALDSQGRIRPELQATATPEQTRLAAQLAALREFAVDYIANRLMIGEPLNKQMLASAIGQARELPIFKQA